MKFIKNFDNYHVNEGAIKNLMQEITDLAVAETDNWLWQGEGPEGFETSKDRHDFVMNAIDDFNNKYYAEDATKHGFIEENKEGIVDQIVISLEHQMGLEPGIVEDVAPDLFSNSEEAHIQHIASIIKSEIYLRDVLSLQDEGEQEVDPESAVDAAKEIMAHLKKEGLLKLE